MKPENKTRRGAALLIVLAVLMLTTVATVILAETTSTAVLQNQLQTNTCQADAILSTADGYIHDWLKSKSTNIVLSPESLTPYVDVLQDVLQFDDDTIILQITAWDQCGMVPISAVQNGSPLRLTLPDAIVQMIGDFKNAKNEEKPVGLDSISVKKIMYSVCRYPIASLPVDSMLIFTSSNQRYNEFGKTTLSEKRNDMLAIGEWIATHNETESPIINVNTAPLPLVEKAMLLAGRGGFELVEQQRSENKPVPLSNLPQVETNGTGDNIPKLVSSSSAWAIRIDITVGRVHRAWWSIYQQKRSGWECTQRLVINE